MVSKAKRPGTTRVETVVPAILSLEGQFYAIALNVETLPLALNDPLLPYWAPLC